jgi:hypothetical protein
MTDPQAPNGRSTTMILRGPAESLARVILEICEPRSIPPHDRDNHAPRATPGVHESQPERAKPSPRSPR